MIRIIAFALFAALSWPALAADRSLSTAEQAALSDPVAKASHIEAFSPRRCRACARYAADIADALRDAGWQVDVLEASPPLSKDKGIVIFVADPAAPTPAAAALIDAFKRSGLAYSVTQHAIGSFVTLPKVTPRGDLIPGEAVKSTPKDAVIWIGR